MSEPMPVTPVMDEGKHEGKHEGTPDVGEAVPSRPPLRLVNGSPYIDLGQGIAPDASGVPASASEAGDAPSYPNVDSAPQAQASAVGDDPWDAFVGKANVGKGAGGEVVDIGTPDYPDTPFPNVSPEGMAYAEAAYAANVDTVAEAVVDAIMADGDEPAAADEESLAVVVRGDVATKQNLRRLWHAQCGILTKCRTAHHKAEEKVWTARDAVTEQEDLVKTIEALASRLGVQLDEQLEFASTSSERYPDPDEKPDSEPEEVPEEPAPETPDESPESPESPNEDDGETPDVDPTPSPNVDDVPSETTGVDATDAQHDPAHDYMTVVDNRWSDADKKNSPKGENAQPIEQASSEQPAPNVGKSAVSDVAPAAIVRPQRRTRKPKEAT